MILVFIMVIINYLASYFTKVNVIGLPPDMSEKYKYKSLHANIYLLNRNIIASIYVFTNQLIYY